MRSLSWGLLVFYLGVLAGCAAMEANRVPGEPEGGISGTGDHSGCDAERKARKQC